MFDTIYDKRAGYKSAVTQNVNVLNKRALEDLDLLYHDIEPSNYDKEEFFWSVMECAGCSEEFKVYLEKFNEKEDELSD